MPIIFISVSILPITIPSTPMTTGMIVTSFNSQILMSSNFNGSYSITFPSSFCSNLATKGLDGLVINPHFSSLSTTNMSSFSCSTFLSVSLKNPTKSCVFVAQRLSQLIHSFFTENLMFYTTSNDDFSYLDMYYNKLLFAHYMMLIFGQDVYF